MLNQLTRQSLAVGLASQEAAIDIENNINAAAVNPFARHFYVNSSLTVARDGQGVGLNPENPFATLAFALTQAVAARGDIIHLAPSHAETIAVAGGITMSKAGVTVIGHGYGSWKPTFTWSAVGSTWLVSAANCVVKNIRCTSSVDEMVKMFSVTAANLIMDAVDVFETASAQIIQFLLTTNAADGITIINCKHVQRTAAAATQIWIQLVGVNDALIANNVFLLTLKNETASYTIGGTTACVDSFLYRNTIHQAGGNTQDKCVGFVTGSTGMMRENAALTGTGVAITAAFVGDAMGFIDNKWHDTIGTASGLLTPAVDTDT